jgi:CRISPR-associated protein Cas2
MMVLVTYDVSTETAAGRKRLARVAKTCKNFGKRVQFSVFECLVDSAQWATVESRLVEIIDPEKDSLRFYFLGANYKPRIVHIGAKSTLDQEGPLIV